MLDDATTRSRIARIQGVLDERSGRVQLWQYGWTGLGYAATGIFFAISATAPDPDRRLDFTFAAAGALIDTSVHLLGSIEIHGAARLREHPEASSAQLRTKLALAEAQLAAAAAAERDRRSLLKAQLLPVGFSVLTGLVLGIGFGHWQGAAINTAAAIVINELRVLTQPTSTIEALRQYRQDPNQIAQGHRSGVAWSLAISGRGCVLQAWF